MSDMEKIDCIDLAHLVLETVCFNELDIIFENCFNSYELYLANVSL